MNTRTKSLNKGFTLVELMVALFVFSLLSAFSYGAVNMLSQTAASTDAEAKSLAELQKAFLFWERDVRQLSHHHLQEGSTEADSPVTIVDGESVQFKMAELLSDKQSKPSVAVSDILYTLTDGVILRQRLGANANEEDEQASISMAVLSDVESMSVELISSGTGSGNLHQGLRLALQHKILGLVQRVIYMGVSQVDADFPGTLQKEKEGG